MKNIIIAISLLLAFGCGAADEEDISTTDDTSDIGTVQEALTIPSGNYAFLKSNVHARCSTAGRCLVPRDKVLRFKMGTDLFIAQTDMLGNLFNQATDEFCATVNAHGWDCARTTGSSNEVLNGITGAGPMGVFTADNINGTVLSDGSGRTFQEFNACHLTINKTAIESDPLFGNQSPTVHATSVKTMIKHLLGHCAGLGNASTNIMSASTMAPVTNTFLTSELNDLQNFQP